MEKNDTRVLALCPPNITAVRNGPKGELGDRVHQLPAVQHLSKKAKCFVWPHDSFTKEVFDFADGILFLTGNTDTDVAQAIAQEQITEVVCLYGSPVNYPPDRKSDLEKLLVCQAIAGMAQNQNIRVRGPAPLDPKGHVPLWKRLLMIANPSIGTSLQWPEPPFICSTDVTVRQARATVREAAGDRPVLVVSPISGSPKRAIEDEWWEELGRAFHYGQILVPVYSGDREKAEILFANVDNKTILVTDLADTASIACLPEVHVLGIDGGRMNVLAASCPKGALVIYGEWPASAWAMPNVVARSGDISAYEAICAVP